jgi:hypothetical protein
LDLLNYNCVAQRIHTKYYSSAAQGIYTKAHHSHYNSD